MTKSAGCGCRYWRAPEARRVEHEGRLPEFGATQGVAGATITSTGIEQLQPLARTSAKFARGSISGAGNVIAPASKAVAHAGSIILGVLRRRSRCSDAPSVVEMT